MRNPAVEADVVLDTSGEVCPVPLVRTRRALDRLERGNVLKVIGTEEASRADIALATRELGMTLMKVGKTNDGKWYVLIRKP